jgi:hypothetical protein
MDLLKKHYEKILFGAVLLGLLGALIFLPFMIDSDREKLLEIRTGLITPRVKPLPPLNLAEQSNAIQRIESSYRLDFEATNRLFNPVQWQRAVNGDWIKIETGSEVGPRAVKIVKITPLYFILTLDSAQTNEFGARYVIGVERQAAPQPWQRAKRQHYASVGEKNDTFTITAVNGPPGDPAQLVLQLTDSGETATLAKGKPFRRVDGYMADLTYAPEGKSWDDRRVGDDLKFAGGDYIIVAINQSEVVLSAQSNQKRTTLNYNSQ